MDNCSLSRHFCIRDSRIRIMLVSMFVFGFHSISNAETTSSPPIIRLQESGQTLDSMFLEVARDVNEMLPPGWTLDPAEVRLKASSDRDMRERLLERSWRTTPPPRTLFGKVLRPLHHFTMKHFVFPFVFGTKLEGSYHFESRDLAISQSSLDHSDYREIKATIAHELVHAAQSQSFPELMSELAHADSPIINDLRKAKTQDQRKNALRNLVASKLLIEGQAKTIENRYRKQLEKNEGKHQQPTPAFVSIVRSVVLAVTMKSVRWISIAYELGQSLDGDFDRLFKDKELRNKKLLSMADDIAKNYTIRNFIKSVFSARRQPAPQSSKSKRAGPSTNHVRALPIPKDSPVFEDILKRAKQITQKNSGHEQEKAKTSRTIVDANWLRERRTKRERQSNRLPSNPRGTQIKLVKRGR